MLTKHYFLGSVTKHRSKTNKTNEMGEKSRGSKEVSLVVDQYL